MKTLLIIASVVALAAAGPTRSFVAVNPIGHSPEVGIGGAGPEPVIPPTIGIGPSGPEPVITSPIAVGPAILETFDPSDIAIGPAIVEEKPVAAPEITIPGASNQHLVQIIINVNGATVGVNPEPVSSVDFVDVAENNDPAIDLPEPVVLPGPSIPVVEVPDVPAAIELPTPNLPVVALPDGVSLPSPSLPEVMIPEPVLLPEPSVPEVEVLPAVVLPEELN